MARPIVPKHVSARTIRKLIRFFQDRVKATGDPELRATYKEIAEGSGVSYAIVKRGLADLQEQGLLEIREVGGRRTPNVYTFLGNLNAEAVPESEAADGQVRRTEILERRLAEEQARVAQLEKELAGFKDFSQRIHSVIDSGRHYVVIVRKGRRGELGINPAR
ncbi:MAG TPA: hypothetical protein VK008_07150 [Sphingobacteriaceae bacterium]|nr:hypothetical protein [Sphingobacteriaceae bacterium]